MNSLRPALISSWSAISSGPIRGVLRQPSGTPNRPSGKRMPRCSEKPKPNRGNAGNEGPAPRIDAGEFADALGRRHGANAAAAASRRAEASAAASRDADAREEGESQAQTAGGREKTRAG